MKALSIRQPYAEMILRGIKKIEYRSRPTRRIGEMFYIYAARTPGPEAEFAALGCLPRDLPTGVILGTAVISRCTGTPGRYEWHLREAHRLARPLKPARHPQPVWFEPFARAA